MRIGNGPRLVIPRPGTPRRRGWYGHYLDRGQAYDEWREQRRKRLRVTSNARWSECQGDVKRQTVPWFTAVRIGLYFRRVDAHGRSYGPRISAATSGIPPSTMVRWVDRQPEDLHSQLSRMLKRAHKDAMKESP